MRRWSNDETAFVREMTAMRFYKGDIAKLLDRSEHSVAYLRVKMGFKFPPAPEPPARPARPIYLVADIKATVARHFGVRSESMSLPLRAQGFVRPRHVAMFLARDVAKRSLPDIGRMFNRDHTTVLSAIRSIRKAASQDKSLCRQIEQIRGELNPVGLSHSPSGDMQISKA